jgi:hypothetical protein
MVASCEDGAFECAAGARGGLAFGEEGAERRKGKRRERDDASFQYQTRRRDGTLMPIHPSHPKKDKAKITHPASLILFRLNSSSKNVGRHARPLSGCVFCTVAV